jgi:hypothetical protein
MDCTYLDQNRDQLRILLSAVSLSLAYSIKAENFLTSRATVNFSKRNLPHGVIIISIIGR